MIKFIKIVDYYQRKKPLRSTESKKQDFAIFDDALNAVINEDLTKVINDKDITKEEYKIPSNDTLIIYENDPDNYIIK